MEVQNGMMARQKRSLFPSIFVVAKKHLLEALENFTKGRIFPVRVENDKVFYKLLSQIYQTLKHFPKIEFKGTPASIQIQQMSEETISRLINQLEELKRITKANRPFSPQVQRVQGKVEVVNQAEFPIDKILNALSSIESSFKSLKIEVPVPSKVEKIKFPEFPKEISLTEAGKILKVLEDVKSELKDLPKKIPEVEFPDTVNIGNFPPQKIPQPVTHISINALAGHLQHRAVTVGTSVTPLPSEILDNRRALIVFNNDSTATLFIGNSNVTTLDGLPVPPKTYSPPLDCGERISLYGISTTNINVRVLEISDIAIGR